MSGVKLKRVTTFPRQVIGGAGIDVKKKNGNFTISLDYAEFGLHSPYVPAPSHRVVIFAQGTGGYFTVPTSVLPALGDPYFANVKLLMGFEGPNGSTGAPGMTDESPSAHGLPLVVSGSISTAQFKFGSSSWRSTGAGGFEFFDNPDWTLAPTNSDKYTVEFWYRINSGPVANQFVGGHWNASHPTNESWAMLTGGVVASELRWLTSYDGSNFGVDITTSGAGIATGAWYFITVDYDGTKARLYVNGVMLASTTPVHGATFDSTEAMWIGQDGSIAASVDAWFDELRITKGVARYASDSGFAVPTAAFPRHA
jgi:hypothetical protein